MKIKSSKSLLITIFILFFWKINLGQRSIDSLKNGKTPPEKINSYKPEIFTSGFIDVMNSGQVNASARFIRLFIGEPGKFAIPLSLYGGVSSNNFQNQQSGGQLLKSNDHLVNQYINPLSGLINISIDGVKYF